MHAPHNGHDAQLISAVHSGPLGRIFDDTTNSYKLFWFRALLEVLEQDGASEIPLHRLTREMVIAAWAPVMLFRLSLGKQDKLQIAVQDLAEFSGIQATARPQEVRQALADWPMAQERVDEFERYVPTRFLTPWFEYDLRGIPDGKRTPIIKQLARDQVGQGQSAPYALDVVNGEPFLKFDPIWRAWFHQNKALLDAYADQGLSNYLQDRNPSVPGIIRKLRVPVKRDLNRARKFWRTFQDTALNEGLEFADFFTSRPLDGSFAIDHFLPWTFVAHDELWNLAPVARETNSRKGDRLPDLDTYIPRLARLHHSAVALLTEHPRLIDDYVSLFGCDLATLKTLSSADFEQKYDQVLRPLAQIAVNQGYRDRWIDPDDLAV